MSPPQPATATAAPAAPGSAQDQLEQQFRAAFVALEQDPRNVEAMRGFALAAQSEGAPELAVRAYFVMCTAHATMRRFEEALLAIEAATRIAKQAGSALRHEADFFRAIVLAEQGEHDQSSRLFIALASGPHFSALRPKVRMDCLRHLAEQCAAAGAVDAALDCWTLLENEAQASLRRVPAIFRILKAAACLDIHVYGDPLFATMIEAGLGDPTPATLRAALLTLADEECSSALTRADEEMAGGRATMAQLLPKLVLAAKCETSQHAAEAADAFESACRTNPSMDTEYRARVVAALARTGQWQRADQLLAQGPAAPVAHTPSLLALKMQYFRCLVLRARGEADGALALYGEYAQQATSTMRQMNLHLRTLMHAITERAGLRPRDRPGYVPRYLVQAQRLLGSGTQALSVADVAREVGVSERTLREAFAVHESKTPKQFQTHARLERARALAQSEKGATQTVEDIALAAGFTHAGRFARMFRDRFGVSVAECREDQAASMACGKEVGPPL